MRRRRRIKIPSSNSPRIAKVIAAFGEESMWACGVQRGAGQGYEFRPEASLTEDTATETPSHILLSDCEQKCKIHCHCSFSLASLFTPQEP